MINSIFDTPSQCRHCGSENLIRQTGTDESTLHYGRLSCSDCGRWHSWLKDPTVSLQWQQRTKVIDKLLIGHGHRLSNWECDFLKSVREQRVLSPKQKDRLNVIGRKCLGVLVCNVGATPPPNLPIKNPERDSSRGVVVH
ncbi:MAG: hypothetical protein SAK29_01265 [Scytonema sp. PMC 1069.18]|nr:hypothetical protein [Scytonema sp. PMC 1069.18]MEC4811904.1 hypothetical protein [Scytonema sp. PMC 1069.18]MEC4884993.1 hypothetical protein [Scytonema sp. PMC 1070.18]